MNSTLMTELKDAIKDGITPSEDLARACYRADILDGLRANLNERDLEVVRSWTNKETPFVRVLAWNLVRNTMSAEDFKVLRGQYEKEADVQAKVSLIFQLMHRPCPPEDTLSYLAFFDSVKQEDFVAIWTHYSGEPGNPGEAHQQMLRRLEDPSYEQKRVLYVYGIGRLGYGDSKSLLDDFRADPSPLVRSVATRFGRGSLE